MLKKSLDINFALEQAKSLPYSMICSLSEVYLGKLRLPYNLDMVSWARFFGEDCEIRLFRDNGELMACEISEDNCDFYDRYYKNANTELFGNGIKVRNIVNYDEDGQAYVSASRLCGLEDD